MGGGTFPAGMKKVKRQKLINEAYVSGGCDRPIEASGSVKRKIALRTSIK